MCNARGMIYMVVGSLDGLPFYLFKDKGYPFLHWLMTLHKRERNIFHLWNLCITKNISEKG
jgi:hypothetical protein